MIFDKLMKLKSNQSLEGEMIDFSEMPKTSVRGAIAAHYTLDSNGIIMTPGEFIMLPYYAVYFAAYMESEETETCDVTSDKIFWLNDDERQAFALEHLNGITLGKRHNVYVLGFIPFKNEDEDGFEDEGNVDGQAELAREKYYSDRFDSLYPQD